MVMLSCFSEGGNQAGAGEEWSYLAQRGVGL